MGTAVALVVLVAVAVGLARQFVSNLHELQPEVAEFLSRQTGLAVDFEDLRGSWKGLAPRVRLWNVRVRQTPEVAPALVARKLDLEVRLLQSLLAWQPRVRLTLDGALLTLVLEQGQIRIEGLDLTRPAAPQNPVRVDDLADLVSAQPRLLVRDSRLVMKGWYDQPVVLNAKNLQIEAGRRTRFMAGDLVLQGPSPLAFQLRAKLRGSLLDLPSVSGNFYLDTAPADWLPWIPPAQREFQQAALSDLKGGAETWLQVRDGRVVDATARFVVHGFGLHSRNAVQPPPVKRLSGLARWQRNADGGWIAGIRDFNMVTPRHHWQPKVLSLAAMPQVGGGVLYGAALDEADIAPWLDYYLSTQPSDGKLWQTLGALHPAGKLEHLSLFLLHKDNALQDLRLAARLRQFHSRPWEHYPGFKDLDLDLWANEGGFVARLQDDRLTLDYPWLFRDPLSIGHAQGTLALIRQDDGFLLQSGLLHLNNNEVRTTTQFSLHLPSDKSLPPFMQLQATLRDVDAKVKSRYLPAGIIPPKLLTWLDEAILAGQLVRGDIVVHGELGAGHDDDHRVLLGFSVRDAELRFLPDWEEPVRHGEADVIVDRGGVWAGVTRGEYFGQTLQQGIVDVPRQPAGGQHVLGVRVQTSGPAETGFSILQKTPLARMTGDALTDMALTGQLAVDLDLAVPLEPGPRNIGAQVDARVSQGQFRLTSRQLQVDELDAAVHFDLAKGLSAQRLRGKALGGVVSGSLATRSLKQGGQITRLDLKGEARLDALQAWLKLSALEPLSGTAPYHLQMELPLGDARKHKHGFLSIDSTLTGTLIDLPAPFGKTAGQQREFRLWQSLDRTPALLGIRYDDLFELSTQTRAGRLQKGALTLGGSKAVLPADDSFRLDGHLARLAPAEWAPLLDRIQSAAARHGEDIQPGSLTLLDQSRLRVDELVLGDQSYGTQHLDLRRQGNGWLVDLAGDFLKGSVQVPFALLKEQTRRSPQTTPLIIHLKRVGVPVADKEAVPHTPAPWQPLDLSPLDLPAADLQIDNLMLGSGDFGQWKMQIRPESTGVRLDNVQARMRGLEFSGGGRWIEANGSRSTALGGTFKAGDIADVMRGWGSEPTLTSQKLAGNLEWQWPGAPFEFAVPRAKGTLAVQVKDGTFNNVKAGVVGRFWSALNFETLMRRLQLDFKDLQEKDMVYDEIAAHGRVDDGLLSLQDLKLDSPTIRIHSQGNIDLNRSLLDLEMNVTVPVTRNLVLPAAIVGGVPAAAAAWAVEKVLGSQFDKLTTIKYSVKGGFDEPQVTVMESFSIIPTKVGESVLSTDKKTPDKPAANNPASKVAP